MASSDASGFRLTVLNPGGHDQDQYFEEGPVAATAHPPINFHAFAACTGGSFQRQVTNAIAENTPVLLLVRGNFKAAERALVELTKAKRLVAVSLKETGLNQIAEQLRDPSRIARFLRIFGQADGCIATTPEAAEVYRQARPKRNPATVGFIPTPYPLEDRQWDFGVPPNEQAGIFVGTREWRVASRNHFAALLAARRLCDGTGEHVTVFNTERMRSTSAFRQLKFPAGKLRIVDKEKPYRDYVGLVAKHKIVFQLDRSRVPGQVAGDALLARTVCVGGDGAIERLAFPQTCGEGRTIEQVAAIALDLLQKTDKRAAAIVESQWRALERVSFRAVRPQLSAFFARLTNSG